MDNETFLINKMSKNLGEMRYRTTGWLCDDLPFLHRSHSNLRRLPDAVWPSVNVLYATWRECGFSAEPNA
jgi:hypothetical protein